MSQKEKEHVEIELTEREIKALAYIMGAEIEDVMSCARINDDGTFELPVFKLGIGRSAKKLARDINYIEKAGEDHYNFLTLEEAKDLLVKLVLASA